MLKPRSILETTHDLESAKNNKQNMDVYLDGKIINFGTIDSVNNVAVYISDSIYLRSLFQFKTH